jgi:anti-sigma-K factor RskA
MSKLDKLLREYASQPTPPPPSNLEDGVWREIRIRRNALVPESLLDWLAACVWRAHVASASIVAAVALGVGMAWLDPNASAAQPVSHPLNLHVFSEHSPTLPLTNLYW